MNVLEKILEEIKQYTKDVYECNLDDIVEYQRRNREDKCTYIVQGIEEATEFIRSHMDEVGNDGWISVKEKLPEKGIYVMCCFDNGEVDVLWQTWQEDESLLFYADIDNQIRKVIAWQPLPAPYKGELNPKDIPHTSDTCRRYGKSDHNCYYCRHKERPDLWETKEKAHE